MADAERYTIYSPKTKRLSVTIVNNIFHMSGYPDLRESNYNRNILPFKDFLGFEVFKSDGKDAHMNVSYSGLERIIDRVKSELEGHEECCLAVSISSHGKIEEKDGKINHFLLCGKPKSDDPEQNERWYCTNDLIKQFSKCLKVKDPNTNRYKDPLMCYKGPVMVFIQACRGKKEDFGTSYYVTDHQEQIEQVPGLDSGIQSMTMASNNGELESDLVNAQGPGTESSLSDAGDQPGPEPFLPDSGDHSASSTSTTDDDQMVHEFTPMCRLCPLHCVVAFASAHKYVSKINNQKGGWLLYSFNSTVKKLRENEECNILSLLTEANNPVSGIAGEEGQKGEKCIGTFQHKLVKELILKRVIETGDADEEVETF